MLVFSWLQGALNRLFKAGLIEDGRLGRQTRKVLQQFQKSTGLAVDGIFDPATRAKPKGTAEERKTGGQENKQEDAPGCLIAGLFPPLFQMKAMLR